MQTARLSLRRLILAAAIVTALVISYAATGAFSPPLRSPRARGIVATDNAEASRAAAEVLKKGGNAADAAVAAALALGVASPAGSGLGGGGFALVWDAKSKTARALDFRESAPKAATRDIFLVDGKADPQKSRVGGLAVAVPGEPAGLVELSRKHGKLGLAASAQPAIRLAREGSTTSWYTEQAVKSVMKRFTPPAGDPIAALIAPSTIAGARVKQLELAKTLELLAKNGSDGFYKGTVARALVDAVKQRGGLLTEDDLLSYKPLWKDPLEGSYRGHRIWVVPPPAGGATLVETLQILEARPPLRPLGAGSSATLHSIAEALKHAFADRARHLGDPAFYDVPTTKLVDPAYAKELAARISDDKVAKPESYGSSTHGAKAVPVEPPRDKGTSHLCVSDGDGNVVALTTTVNLSFGAKLMAAGVSLNNEMDDFAAQPGVPNAFGLVGAAANAVAAGKRPLSSMTPTVVTKDGIARICAGGSGGPFIVSETAQVIINVVDFGMDANAAVMSPRIHAQWMPDVLFAEEEIAEDVREGLRKRGHKVVPPPEGAGGAAQALVLRDETVEAASNPRKGGAPAAP